MKRFFYRIGFVCCVALTACGSGDTGDGYNSMEAGDLNTDPNVTFTDSASSIPAGASGHPDSSINVTPQGTGTDTGMTNINRGGAR